MRRQLLLRSWKSYGDKGSSKQKRSLRHGEHDQINRADVPRCSCLDHEYREIVLGRIAAAVKKFVYKVSVARGLSEAAATAAGGKIYTFGSYRLGVHGPGSDLDTLCVVPKHVNREDFFEVLEPMLKDIEGVTEVAVSILPYLIDSLDVLIRVQGCTRSLCSCYRNEDIWHPYRPYNGPPNAFDDT